jgi:hypothetical protein
MARTLEWIVIDRALRLIRDKRNWTRNVVTRRSNGIRCRPGDPDAIRYCAFGALVRAAIDVGSDADAKLALTAERAVIRANGWNPRTRLAAINDRRGHRAVVRAFELALKNR